MKPFRPSRILIGSAVAAVLIGGWRLDACPVAKDWTMEHDGIRVEALANDDCRFSLVVSAPRILADRYILRATFDAGLNAYHHETRVLPALTGLPSISEPFRLSLNELKQIRVVPVRDLYRETIFPFCEECINKDDGTNQTDP